ncbi:hypothetical protein AB4Y77_01995 [Paenarthrobacter sp. YAF11_1]
MAKQDPRELSGLELDELLDKMVQSGEADRDTPAWTAAYAEWERREEEQQ